MLDFPENILMEACLYTAVHAQCLLVLAPMSFLREGTAGIASWVTLQALTTCVMQPATARSNGQSRNSTDFGLLHGQESSTSGLDRMSSTQVILPQHTP